MLSKETYENFTVIYDNKDYSVDFKVYEVIAHDKDDSGGFTIPFYEGIGGSGCDDKMTLDIEKANTFITGAIKWDGCSHLWFGDEERYIHMCGKYSLKNLLFIIDKVYKRSGELMEKADKSQFCEK